MKKAVPLALVLGSSSVLGQNLFVGTWTSPTTQAVTTNCCYFNPTSTTSFVVPTGNSPYTPTGGVAASEATGCAGFKTDGVLTTGTLAFAPTITTSTAVAGTYSDTNSEARWATTDGSTLTFTPGTVAQACPSQTFTRSGLAPITTLSGAYTVAAGTTTGCTSTCYLDTTKDFVFTTNTAKTIASGSYAASANCAAVPAGSNGGQYAKALKAGTSPVTAEDYLSSTPDQFVLNADKTITYRPLGSTTCTQVLTPKPTSSALSVASVMTPVVVGTAMLGLVVV